MEDCGKLTLGRRWKKCTDNRLIVKLVAAHSPEKSTNGQLSSKAGTVSSTKWRPTLLLRTLCMGLSIILYVSLCVPCASRMLLLQRRAPDVRRVNCVEPACPGVAWVPGLSSRL